MSFISSYDDTLVVPIIENTPEEKDLKDRMARAMEEYPDSCAVLVRRHGVYVWGESWEKAKTMWARCAGQLTFLDPWLWLETQTKRVAFVISPVCRCECYDYLFDIAVQMKQCGLDPSALPAEEKGIVWRSLIAPFLRDFYCRKVRRFNQRSKL